MKTETNEKLDVYGIITERMISLLETGVIPWHKPWKATGNDSTMPRNFVSKKAYRGVNVFLLLCSQFECPFFVSYKQATELGGNVRKGEKGFPVVFWNWFGKKVDGKPVFGPDGRPEMVPFLRYYTVFNLEQTEGIAWEKPVSAPDAPEFNPLAECETIVANMPKRPEIRHGGARACYSPALDFVGMPLKESFDNPPAYYSTLFHELTHATGHKTRLARKEICGEGAEAIAAFGDANYSREELVAEMGAAFLCGFAGVVNSTLENSAAYCAGWIKKLKGEPKLIVTAAAQAQKASDFVLNVKHETEA